MAARSKFKRWLVVVILPGLLFFNLDTQAKKRRPPVDVKGVIDAVMKTYGVNVEQLETANKQITELQRMYKLHEEQLKNEEQTKNALTGKNNYGLKEFKTYTKAWLHEGTNLSELLNEYKRDNSTASNIYALREQEFPLDLELLNTKKFNQRDSAYHKLSSKIALASRAASEIEFNRIEQKLKDQEQLQKDIDNTQTLKAALDLLVRMQAENNKIMLENLRMMTLLTQQTSIAEQAKINARVQSAKFLTN